MLIFAVRCVAALLLFCFIAAGCLAQTFHAIIVADTNKTDVVSGAKASMDLMKAFGREVARNTSLTYDPVPIMDDAVSADYIMSAVNGLSVGPDDVVLFYYVGHGVRSTQGDLPLMWVGIDRGDGLDANMVRARIQAKHPRLAIILVEACNVRDNPYAQGPLASLAQLSPSQENYNPLFRSAKGELVAMAAQPGESAYIDKALGGYFTNAFLAVVKNVSDWGDGATQLRQDLAVTRGAEPLIQHPRVEWLEASLSTPLLAAPLPRATPPSTVQVDLCGKSISYRRYGSPQAVGFGGIWSGNWNGRVCAAFIVENVNADGDASIVYSYASLRSNARGEFRQPASISGSALEFTENEGGHYRFVLRGDRLDGYFRSATGAELMTTFFRQ